MNASSVISDKKTNAQRTAEYTAMTNSEIPSGMVRISKIDRAAHTEATSMLTNRFITFARSAAFLSSVDDASVAASVVAVALAATAGAGAAVVEAEGACVSSANQLGESIVALY